MDLNYFQVATRGNKENHENLLRVQRRDLCSKLGTIRRYRSREEFRKLCAKNKLFIHCAMKTQTEVDEWVHVLL
jgi:hypothetical protein